MVSWQDPSVVAICAVVYSQNAIFLLGFFGKHLLTRTDIEWSLITGRRRPSLALIPYLYGRYAILVTLLYFVIQDLVNYEISCDIAYKAFAILGSSASFCSTLNLGIRSYIIWRDMNKRVVWLLSLACVGHAALVCIQGAKSVSSEWSPQARSCVVTQSSNVTMFTFYMYTVVMDFTILCLTICGLWRKAALQSSIGTTLSEQCLWYCAATFLVNLPAAIFPILNLNVIMNVMFSMPAATSGQRETPTNHDVYGRTQDHALPVVSILARSHQVATLTTNIVLESQVTSSDAQGSLGATSTTKTQEEGLVV
ncbi:hypothetical protein PYCCODRAFT_304066 [Trametes coccinea BRFM310]|uniref:G-protein coupled receptors family 1 profile domain-containing protein n=1 Tax=Trametes coccinea (strain BRFM310) TaxID=1353009 RepID=A0A1Y2IQ18_TRAC3|nr:hypothetical protein PYCCODRAFT_304066 [Trametes coccinea BRFM310]